MTWELECTGLRGDNPLAFLAAVGLLRVVSIMEPAASPRLSWRMKTCWRPVISAEIDLSVDFYDRLACTLKSLSECPAFRIGDDLNFSPSEFHTIAVQASNSVTSQEVAIRYWADFLAAFASEACTAGDDGTLVSDTSFRTMKGAGHQHFLKTMRDLAAATTAEKLREAVIGPWGYQDRQLTLRWDPVDDRRYARRWANPSGDTAVTVHGANRLAVEALPLFPTQPTTSGLVTTGFRGRLARDTKWTWPIWESPATIDLVRTLLALRELQASPLDRKNLVRMGIADAYQSSRITVGKVRNFTRAVPA